MQNNEASYNRTVYAALRIGFIAVLIYWSFAIIKPFVMPVAWGIIIAVAVYPLHQKIARLLGNREKLASVLITLIGLALLIIPSIFFIDSTVAGLQNFASQLKAGTLNIPLPAENVAGWPVIGKPIYDIWLLFSQNADAAIIKFAPQLKGLAAMLLSAASGLGKALIMFIISIIIAGALFNQAEASKRAAKSIFATLIGKHGDNFTELSVSIIRSVLQGILLVALIQSLLGGIGIQLIGIPAAGLWAIIILLLAIMQLPPLLILGPLAIYAFTIADTTPAVLFLIWSILVSLSDAILKPLLLGRGVSVPMLAVLLGAIGGMILSGIIGLFVGAVVLAISYKLFEALLVEDILEGE